MAPMGVGGLVVYAILWNNISVPKPPSLRINDSEFVLRVPADVRWLGHALALDQQWNMFAPKPFENDGWYLLFGQRSDTSLVSLWPHREYVSMDKPAHVADVYPTQRWRKYWMNLWYPQYEQHRRRALRHACRAAEREGESVDTVYMVYVEEPTAHPDGPPRPLDCRLFEAARCDGRSMAKSTPLPPELQQCDRLAWAPSPRAAAEGGECDSSDYTCQLGQWRTHARGVERYLGQIERGTVDFNAETVSEMTKIAIKRLKSCADPRLVMRLH